MLKKDIFNSSKPLENLANQILYQFVSKGTPYSLPDNFETFVKDGYAGNVNIYSIIRKIVNPSIGVKWKLEDKQTDEEAIDQTMMMLLNHPNKKQSKYEFLDEALCWRLITGNRYIYVLTPETGANAGKPAELHLLPASEVEIIQGDWLEPVQSYHLRIGDVYKTIPAGKVIHGKTTNLKYDLSGSQLYGMAPLEAALKVMAATNSGYDRMAQQFENGGPDVIITGTKETATQEWTQEQFDTVWQRFVSKFRKKSKERFMLKNLPVEVHEIGRSVVDLNVLEYIKLSLRDYCNIYGVPSALMNDNEYATQSANAREYQRQLWNNAIIPELEMLKEDLNKVCKMYNDVTGQQVYFEYELHDIPELQEDITIQAAGLSSAWWMTINERREAMGLDKIEMDGDVIMAPMGIAPLMDVTDPIETPELDKSLHGYKY